MNHYPHHVGDYLKKTIALTMVEDGAYRRAIDWYYSYERPLPRKPGIYAELRCASKQDRAAVDAVLARYFTETDDGYRHDRCDKELAHYREKSAKAKASAYLSVAARQANATATAHTNAERTLSERSASQNQNHKPEGVKPVVGIHPEPSKPKPAEGSAKGKNGVDSARWWVTDAGTIAEGKRRGVNPRPGEQMDAFRDRVRHTKTAST